MAGRGAQSFQKRQKEQQRKEKQQEKFAKRLERKRQGPAGPDTETDEQAPPDMDMPSAAAEQAQ